jgi:glycosyltransferase involved in cell wall biosynthesis
MPQGKKVVIIGPAYPLRGGLASYNERLAKAYNDQGHQVIVYTYSLQYPSVFFPGKTQLSDDPAPEGLDIRVRINSVNPFNWVRAGNEIRKQRPDLVIIRYWIPFMAPCLGTIARIIHRNGFTRIIAIADNIFPHEKRIMDKQLTRYFVRSVEGFVFMSQSVMADLGYFDARKPRQYCAHPLYDTYGEPVDKETARRELGLEINGLYLLFFGFIRDYKGLDILLSAMADDRLKQLKIRLIVAGEFYSDPAFYKKIIEDHHIGDRVLLFNDFISNREVYKFFCAADLVVQPYKSATQSGVTQIAYHFNKPMVLTDVGGLPELVPDGKAGYIVKPDPQSLAGAIERFYLLNKEAEFSRFVEEEKKKYSWDNMIVHIFAVEQEIQKRSSNP